MLAQQISEMINMLPDDEQALAFELIKRLVLAWDPDFVKVTPAEAKQLQQAELGEFVRYEDINWD